MIYRVVAIIVYFLIKNMNFKIRTLISIFKSFEEQTYFTFALH